MLSAVLGWGGFTWRMAENAIARAIEAGDRVDRLEIKITESVDRLEVKMAEKYLTKTEFETFTNRLFDTLGEMRAGQQYLVEKVDYHVLEQAGESKQLRAELDKQIQINDRLKKNLED